MNMQSGHLSEQELVRRKKLAELKRLGIDPYPAPLYPVNTYSTEIKNGFDDNDKTRFAEVCLAGRIMSVRDMGKASFAVLQDSQGRIQIYVRKDDLAQDGDTSLYDVVWKKLLDIGDFVGVKGFVFRTKTGEISVHVKELRLLGKSLRPLPIVKEAEGQTFDAVTDPEFKYRQRYADLVINPSVKEVFVKRTKLINSMREFLNSHGALEVDTPVLQSIPGGAIARPFITHHNALDVPFYLRIANELYLKRLIVGGFDWVYEFSRNFRNEGMDRTHNPEFTILEFYTAYKDYIWMMNVTENMLEKTAIDVTGSADVLLGNNTISFRPPFKRISIYDAIKEHTGFDVSEMNEEQLRDVCKKLRIEVDPSMGKGKLIDEIFGEKCEQHYI